MANQISLFIQDYQSLVYLIVFIAIIIEGDVSLLLFGALSKEHVLNFFGILPIAIAASIVHDLLFWRLGQYISKTNRKKYLFVNFEKIRGALERIGSSIGIYIMLSKFAWNFNRVIIVSSGYIRTPFKKFIKFSAISGILWAISYMSLGFVFADQTNLFKKNLLETAVLVSLVVVIMALFEIYIKKLLKKYFFEINGSMGSNNVDNTKKP